MKNFEDLTELEKNVLITEKIFDLKVIFPETYYATLKGKNADYWRERCETSGNSPVVVKGNKPLKTHSIESRPMPDFYNGAIRCELIARARAVLFERNLHLRFAEFLADSFEPPDFWKNLHWNLINAAPEIQADCIVKVLLEEK